MSEKEIKRTEIGDLGEFAFIDRITKDFKPQVDTIKGVGDDAAVFKGSKNTLVSTDFLIEGIHFDLSYTPLRHLGYKAVVVNVSDIYAMNGSPEHITVSLAISNRFSVEAIEELYAGVKLACEYYNIDLIGGDTTASDKGLVMSVTVIGMADKPVYRSGAKEGDLLCVTGNFGAAYMGLQLLIREKQVYESDPNMQPEINDKYSYILRRILKPEAKKEVIEYFHKENIIPNAMIDVSDGLSSEVLHICKQSGVGAIIGEDEIPIDQQTYDFCMELGLDPTIAALSGGEDYELLFTADKSQEDKLLNNDDVRIIGEITAKSEGVKLKTRSGNLHDITAQGWKSF